MGICCLRIYGDSELVVNQVRSLNTTKNNLLKSYRNRVWDLLEDFHAINLFSIPRNRNKHADRLAAIGAEFDVPKEVNSKGWNKHIKVVVRPAIPDNSIHLQVFYND